MLVEGRDEILMALAAGHVPNTLITAPMLVDKPVPAGIAEVVIVSDAVFRNLSYREHPDGWLAVFPLPAFRLEDLKLSTPALVLAIQTVEKPGNLGAILRTADAAGIDVILVCDPRVDLYGPNVVRASRGALFSVPVIQMTSEAAFAFLQSRQIKIVATTPDGDVDYTRQDLRGPVSIAMGTEDKGLSADWLERADARVRIPMRGHVNSLNVSTAAALLVYEALRQRSAGPAT